MSEGYSTWSVCACVCVCARGFSLFWHLAQSRVQTAVSATSTRNGHEIKNGIFLKNASFRSYGVICLPRQSPATFKPLSLLFQRRSILKLFKRLTMGYALPGTPLDIRQKTRVLWQSLSLLSQCSEHVTIPHNFRICLRASARVVTRVNGTDIRTSCSPHPLIVDCC